MGKIWRLHKAASFKEAKKNLFIITFSTEAENQRVMVGRPWLFDNNLFILKSVDGRIQLTKKNFNSELCWFQPHRLLVRYMNRYYGELIGNTIGRVLDVDVDTNDTGWGSFVLVKVELNLPKPLAHGRTISVLGEDLWIHVKYKKLPKFCFECGRILLEDREYSLTESPSIA